MKLEDQVCSLELAKKLKELGVKQESHFYWRYDSSEGFSGGLRVMCEHSVYTEEYSAFTVAELGEMLPFGMSSIHIDTRISTDYAEAKGGNWLCKNENRGKRRLIYANTEADARAKMLVYLLENDLITRAIDYE